MHVIILHSDASFKIKNKIVDIQNLSDKASNNDIIYTFSDGIIINAYIMSDSNTNPNYAPFIRIRYNKINNNYTIKIYLIIYSNANGNNFNNKGSTGRIIIYYIYNNPIGINSYGIIIVTYTLYISRSFRLVEYNIQLY